MTAFCSQYSQPYAIAVAHRPLQIVVTGMLNGPSLPLFSFPYPYLAALPFPHLTYLLFPNTVLSSNAYPARL